MPCPSTDLQNRRVIHACTPTPIVRGIAKAETFTAGAVVRVFSVGLFGTLAMASVWGFVGSFVS